MKRRYIAILNIFAIIHGLVDVSDSSCCKLRTTRRLGLSNYWPIDGNTNDYAGSAHMYGLVNATLTKDRFGRPNSAISFKYGYAQLPGGVYFNGEFTAMAWIKAKDSVNWNRIFDFATDKTRNYIILSHTSNVTLMPCLDLHNLTHSGNKFFFNETFKLNEWTHIAVIKTKSEYIAFINGRLVNRLTNRVLPVNVTRNTNYIGKSNWALNLHTYADMDDIKIFNKAISDDDVYFHFKSNVIFVVKI